MKNSLFKKHLDGIVEKILKDNLNKEELMNYTANVDKNCVDGELIRSYFISHKDGINIVWDELSKTKKFLKATLSIELEAEIEEYLETINFDEFFCEIICEIKSCL